MFIPTWGDDPIWLTCFRWVETTNQNNLMMLLRKHLHEGDLHRHGARGHWVSPGIGKGRRAWRSWSLVGMLRHVSRHQRFQMNLRYVPFVHWNAEVQESQIPSKMRMSYIILSLSPNKKRSNCFNPKHHPPKKAREKKRKKNQVWSYGGRRLLFPSLARLVKFGELDIFSGNECEPRSPGPARGCLGVIYI